MGRYLARGLAATRGVARSFTVWVIARRKVAPRANHETNSGSTARAVERSKLSAVHAVPPRAGRVEGVQRLWPYARGPGLRRGCRAADAACVPEARRLSSFLSADSLKSLCSTLTDTLGLTPESAGRR